MRDLEFSFCHIKEIVNAKIPFIYVMYPFSLGNDLGTSLIIGNLVIIRVTSVEWTWSGLEWPPA